MGLSAHGPFDTVEKEVIQMSAKDTPMSNVKAIRMFFDDPKVTMAELKALTVKDRQQLGDMIREELDAQ